MKESIGNRVAFDILDLWEASQLQARRLCSLQSMVLAEFPEYYKQLPDTLEHYLQLRSLFALIEALWVRLAKRYKSARKSLEEPCEQIPDKVINLKSMLREIQAMPLESFVSKTKDGLLDLEKMVLLKVFAVVEELHNWEKLKLKSY